MNERAPKQQTKQELEEKYMQLQEEINTILAWVDVTVEDRRLIEEKEQQMKEIMEKIAQLTKRTLK